MVTTMSFLRRMLLVGILLTFCSDIHSQILTKEDMIIYKDVVYSIRDGHELKLDIAVPKCLTAPAPAIVDIPGGAWRVINKSIDDAIFYAQFGFIGVSITYRTSDVAIFPAAIHDCKTALRFLRAHAQEYNIDAARIGVTGFSSGGHLAALLGTSGGDKYLEGNGEYPEYSSNVQAVVDHFGPTDFLQMNDTTGLNLEESVDHFTPQSAEALFLGGPVPEKASAAQLANPINYIDPKDPPTLIGHGEKDAMVLLNQSKIFYEALKKTGVPTEFVRVKNAVHMYRPYKWDAIISPSVEELDEMTIKWFVRWLGAPKLDLDQIRGATSHEEKSRPSAEYGLYYKITVELPGKTAKSFCKGLFNILCDGKVLAGGQISLTDLSTLPGRQFKKEFIIGGDTPINKVIMWNYRGEIYDSKLDKKFEFMKMARVEYEQDVKGIGFEIDISDDGDAEMTERVYR
jgi:acetyl esterase/lipase